MHKICILLLPGIALAYHILCPDRSHRQLRSHALCTKRDNTKSVYTCLEDVYRPRLTFIESCSEEEDVVRRGNRYVIKGQSTIGNCSTDRYQPILFYKTSGPLCMYVTSTCTDVGQLIATKGSGISDTTCICDYTEGHAYVTRPVDVCNCVPSEEDCTCYVKLCPENYLLSADYECIHRDVISLTKCASLDKSENNLTSTTKTTMKADSTAFNESPTRIKYANYAVTVMVVIVLMSVVISGVLFFLINRDIGVLFPLWCMHTRYIEYFFKTLDTRTCIEGENVQFECEVLDYNQTAHWFKDGTEVRTSDKYKVERHGRLHRLVINNTKPDDKGEYSVKIKNCVWWSNLIVKENPLSDGRRKNKENYLQIVDLLHGPACNAVRSKFDKIIPPETLSRFINDNHDQLETLRNDKEITAEQWNFLYPKCGNPASSKFSLNLMHSVILLSTAIIKDSKEHQALQSLKSYQYTLNENTDSTIDDNDFDDYFKDICAAILFLGGNSYQKQCASVAPAKQAVLDQILQEIDSF